jgi:hypothetical protein
MRTEGRAAFWIDEALKGGLEMLWHVENGWLPSVQHDTRQVDAATSSNHYALQSIVFPASPSANKARERHAARRAGSCE